MTDSHEAAAFWGTAENRAYPPADRLACALAALEFYGGKALAEEEDPTPGTALTALATAADELNTALGGGTMARQDTEETLTQLRSLRLAIKVLQQLDSTYVQHLYLTAEHGKHTVDGVGEVWVTRTRSSVKWDERGTAAAIVDAKMAEREGEVPDDPMDVVTWLLEAASVGYYRKGALKAMGIDPDAYVDSLPGKPQVTLDL